MLQDDMLDKLTYLLTRLYYTFFNDNYKTIGHTCHRL